MTQESIAMNSAHTERLYPQEDALEPLYSAYKAYVSETEKYYQEKGHNKVFFRSLFSGGAELAQLPAQNTFFQQVEESAACLCDMLSDMLSRGEAEKCFDIAEKAMRFMLCEDKTSLRYRESLSYNAAETYSECLVRFLSVDARRRILTDYSKRFKSERPLPNQTRIIKALSED